MSHGWGSDLGEQCARRAVPLLEPFFGQVAWLSFGIASSDRIVSKTGVPVTLCFTLATLLPIGGTITLSYPAGFFAVSTPTEQPGSSSVAGFTGTCAATTSTSVVVNSAGATVPASSFVITLPGFVMGGVTAGTVGVTLATSADTAASVAVSSGSIATQVTIVSLSINANDRITLKPSVPITLSFPPTTLLLPGATITILFQTAFSRHLSLPRQFWQALRLCQNLPALVAPLVPNGCLFMPCSVELVYFDSINITSTAKEFVFRSALV